MGEGNFKVLGLAASLRRASIHRRLLRASHEACPQGMACESFDLGRIPFFNADVEASETGEPEPVRELKDKIRAYDAVLIASPEYDYAVPGVLATALDWCLRSPSPLRHKPVGIAGASPGGSGTVRGQMVLRQILLHGPAYVMPEPQMMIPNTYERFDEDGNLTDEETRQRLGRFLGALREWAGRLERAGLAERAAAR